MQPPALPEVISFLALLQAIMNSHGREVLLLIDESVVRQGIGEKMAYLQNLFAHDAGKKVREVSAWERANALRGH
jgi:hypothetical protein